VSRRILAVLFDMGGVLMPEVSSFELAARDAQLIAALRALGVADPSALVADAARRVREAYRSLESTQTQPDLDDVLRDVAPAVRRLLLRAFALVTDQRPYGHVLPILRRLARHYRLGVASNNIIPGDHHLRTLQRSGLMRYIGCAVWSANFGRRKPHPAMLQHVLARLAVPARRALFVGDKVRTDVLAARSAGTLSALLCRPGAAPDGQTRPDFTIRGLGELPLLLRQLG
jgi:HAD superfamily hydrolase (TIGR01549 family)